MGGNGCFKGLASSAILKSAVYMFRRGLNPRRKQAGDLSVPTPTRKPADRSAKTEPPSPALQRPAPAGAGSSPVCPAPASTRPGHDFGRVALFAGAGAPTLSQPGDRYEQ